MSSWTIRNLMSPVITRMLIYEVNAIDVEGVMREVESRHHLNAKSLERSWLNEWETRASRYRDRAEEALRRGDDLTASTLLRLAARCYYAAFLINPSSNEEKRRIYLRYAELYRDCESHYPHPAMRIEIPLDNGVLPGYLHLPHLDSGEAPSLCAVIFSGLGSCKEEMHMLARPLVQRGVAAFVPDMPGNGEALFESGVKCRRKTLDAAFRKIPDVLSKRKELRDTTIGSYGLCMGGGYAHRAACIDPRYRFCVTLFMLYITHQPEGTTPQWMRQGDWYEFQTGGLSSDDFLEEMAMLAEGALEVPYLFIHGRHDNWMPLETAKAFFDGARGEKQSLIIEEAPVFSGEQLITHTMPVGEQLSWIRHEAADWIALRGKD